MLFITRRKGEKVVIGDGVTVEVVEVAGNSVRLAIEAPRAVPIYRAELWAAVKDANQADGLVAAGWSPSPVGDIVEAVESRDPGRLVLAVQCHPERTESTPPAFDRVWRVFVDACRGPASNRTVRAALHR